MGTPETGKTHLAISIGIESAKIDFKLILLIAMNLFCSLKKQSQKTPYRED